MQNYNKQFIKLLNDLPDYEYVGLGNPNSKILIVGKEAAINIDTFENLEQIRDKLKTLHGSKMNWLSNQFDYSHNPNTLKELSDTWQNYQQLFNNIFPNKRNTTYATFLKDFFTTEISSFPAKTTNGAKKNPFFKEELQMRKNTFLKSDFIQGFPVVVLSCSDYIVNIENQFEINDIFRVKYNCNSKRYSKGNWFYNHYNEDKTKLVIHTRQLSSNVNNQLLTDIGESINIHLKKLNII
jgi:hypothetical protein